MTETTAKNLEQAIDTYLLWMKEEGYHLESYRTHKATLHLFLDFIRDRAFEWDDVFTLDTVTAFQKHHGLAQARGVKGLSRYLFGRNRIRSPIEKIHHRLPLIYEDYLTYHEQSRQAPYQRIRQITAVLAALHNYLEKHHIGLSSLDIAHIDAFMAEFFETFAPATCRAYRSIVRGFLRYLHQDRKILKRDLATLIKSRRSYSQAKPPRFLRPREIQSLFAGLKLSTPSDLRDYAMVHLAYYLGLRPFEIVKIRLNDISFAKRELTLEVRKEDNPMTLPVPEPAIKAIAAYILKGRPKSSRRTLFLTRCAPHRPMRPNRAGCCIRDCMRRVNLPATAYWLRHTYAQNLLESGVTIFEIMEMMGHDKIESTKVYLHVHVKLMRKVLFHEAI
jgi:site-specific recombinase XerD